MAVVMELQVFLFPLILIGLGSSKFCCTGVYFYTINLISFGDLDLVLLYVCL